MIIKRGNLKKMNWILIAVLIILAFIIFKFKETKHRTHLIAITLIILFLVVSVTAIYSENNFDLKTVKGVAAVGKVYFSWLVHVFKNGAKVVGDATKLDWSVNASNLTK